MLYEWSRETGLRVKLTASRWYIESLSGEDQVVVPMPYGKAIADPKFLSWNLASIFVDEANNMPAGSRKNLISRLRAIENPKAIWCYNPIDKNNFKKELYDPIVSGAMEGNVWVFKPSDNPSLPHGYIEMQEWNYPSRADRVRMLEGEWSAMEGLVYPDRFTSHSERTPKGRVRALPEGTPEWYAVGVDPDDGSGTTAALLLARFKQGIWIVDEWYNRQSERAMDTPSRAAAIYNSMTQRGRRSITSWVIDVNGGDMIPEIAHLASGNVRTSGRPPLPVVSSINHVKRFFNNEWLWISPSCTNLIEEGSKYHYPEDADTRYGEIKPVKKDDHGLDAARYVIAGIAPLQAARAADTMDAPIPARRF